MSRFLFGLTILLALSSGAFGDEKSPGYDSPEKAFQTYLTACVDQDFDLMLSSLTPESQAYHIGLTVMSVGYLFEKEAAEKIMREHAPAGGSVAPGKDESEDAVFVRAMLAVKNPAQLMKKVANREKEITGQLAKAEAIQDARKQPTTKEVVASVALKNVKIQGVTARANVEFSQPAKDLMGDRRELLKVVEFRRIKNRWYCHIDPR